MKERLLLLMHEWLMCEMKDHNPVVVIWVSVPFTSLETLAALLDKLVLGAR